MAASRRCAARARRARPAARRARRAQGVGRDRLPRGQRRHGRRPGAGGLLIAITGLEATYAIDASTFVVSLLALRAMRTLPPAPDAPAPSCALGGRGLAVRRLAPGAARDVPRRHQRDVLRHAARPVPGARRSATAARGARADVRRARGRRVRRRARERLDGHVHRHGRGVALAAAAWGVAIVGFGFADALWLALVCLAVAGAMDSISGLFRSTIWNARFPDSLRGRLAGDRDALVVVGPELGGAEAGAVAALRGPTGGRGSGAASCASPGTAVLVALLPRFLELRLARVARANCGWVGR